MKKLIICETPFQVIVALCIMKQFSSENDSVDIAIVNNFSGYDKIAENLKKEKVFDNVLTFDAKNIVLAKGIIGNIKKLFYVLFLSKLMKKIKISKFYDEIYSWNYDALTASIRSYHALKKKPAKYYIYDEGYISYFPIDEVISKRGFMKIIEVRNKLLGLHDIVRKNIDGLLLFEPDLLIYKPNCEVYKITRNDLNDKKFIKLISNIFNVGESYKKYDKKYIIFEEAMFSNDNKFDDEKIIENIVDKLGKDNVIIKLHPRTSSDRFSKKGIKVLGSDGVPWEALTIVGDFSDKVLISIGSGSIPNYKIFLGESANGILLFDIYKPVLKYMNMKYSAFWDKIRTKEKNKGIFIPRDNKELMKILNTIGSE